MNYLIIFLIVIGAVFYKLFSGNKDFWKNIKTFQSPFRKKHYLLSIAEHESFEVLEKIATAHNCYLFPKVRIEDVFLPLPENKRSLRGYVKSRHIDFLLCQKDDLRPVIAVELDDSSHTLGERIRRDKLVDKIFNDAGLPILHVPVKPPYNSTEIAERIQEAIK